MQSNGRPAGDRRGEARLFRPRLLAAVVAVFAVGLVVAPGAGAVRGIAGYTEMSGAIDNGRDVAVNFSGAGQADPGDFYVSDRQTGFSGSKVVHFSATGEFIRSWGTDAVQAGPGNANETQLVSVSGTGGSFTLTFGNETTGAIPFNADATVVGAELNGLASIGGNGGEVIVTGGPGDAAGSNPYVVEFGAVMAGANQPLIAADDSGLSGGLSVAFTATTNDGGIGFEICEPARGDVCTDEPGSPTPVTGVPGSNSLTPEKRLGGSVFSPAAVAVDQTTGDVYVSALNRLNKFSATGEFIYAAGYDTVAAGPNDSTADEHARVKVTATGGVFTLTFAPPCCGQETTTPIPYNAPASGPGSVEEALNDLDAPMSAIGGRVTVTGGPSGPSDPGPWTYDVRFRGNLGGDDTFSLSGSAENLSGTPRSVVITNDAPRGGTPEVCTAPSNACKEGGTHGAGGALGTLTGLAIAPADHGLPNEGNVLATHFNGARVLEFQPDGQFVRTFGWDVTGSGPGDSAIDEQQQIALGANTTGGKFSLSFGGATTGAVGTGNRTSGSNVIDNALATNGAFAVGQIVTGTGIPSQTTITAVGPGNTLTLSANATSTGVAGNLIANDIDYNASVAQVQAALNALPTIGGTGGSVSVGGGPGPGTPYTATFEGSLGGDDVGQLTASTPGLTVSGGSPSATVTTLTTGGGFEVCEAGSECQTGASGPSSAPAGRFTAPQQPTALAVDSTGVIYAVDGSRVQKFTPSGGTFTPSIIGTNEVQAVSVAATGGEFRLGFVDPTGNRGHGSTSAGSNVISNFTLQQGSIEVGQQILNDSFPYGTVVTSIGPSTVTASKPSTGNSFNFTFHTASLSLTGDIPATASAGQLETALNGLPRIQAGGGSVSVSGGPGDASGSTPYTITFGGGPRQHTDLPQLVSTAGSNPLIGGTGPNANEALVETAVNGGPTGSGSAQAPVAVTAGQADELFVAKRYPLTDAVCDDGFYSPEEVRIQEFTPAGAVPVETSKQCTIENSHGTNSIVVDGLAAHPTTGDLYAFSHEGLFGLPARLYVYREVGTLPDLALDPPASLSPTATGATVSGAINPNGPGPITVGQPSNTTYRIEYRKTSETDWELYSPDTSVGTGFTPEQFSVGLSGLIPRTEYEARVVVTKPFGFKEVAAVTAPFTTLTAAPTISAFSSGNVTADSVDLRATINPGGAETTYHFEYGPTRNYGSSTPEVSIGDGSTPVNVLQHVVGLDPVVHHFRVVAKNAEGTTVSGNQTFNFYPEPCPNAAVRQQTGSSDLPDCRAYELVSPANAGTATLNVGGPNSPRATSPSRLSFLAAINAIPGPWNPTNGITDPYVATRSATGWTTNYYGGEAHEISLTGQPFAAIRPGWLYADLGMDRFLQWRAGSSAFESYMAPYVTSAAGETLGRWPTNLDEMPGAGSAGAFVGAVEPSEDFSHYVFSSANLAFAPGGVTSGAGSVYDNDVGADTVEIASKLPLGGDIPREPGILSDVFLQLPDTSVDGSHILMSSPGTGLCGANECPPPGPSICGTFSSSCPTQPGHLYMRVNGGVTYDVSRGHIVRFEGMTDDGSQVLFTSAEQVTADDTDTSVDLYAWREDGDSVTRLSVGSGGVGNTDACGATWIGKCGIQVVPKGEHTTIFGNPILSQPTDNSVASGSGSVYFYSPEQFVGSNGVPGRRNLYVSHDGQIQYVATLDAANPAIRIQVSPSGRHAAFITASELTSFDTAGFEQMYRYDADSGELVCVSCAPGGESPTANVRGSLNGIFLANDGRPFFSTPDPLVPRDTNGLVDVYEYVDSRPQLISSGIAASDTAAATSGPNDLSGKAGLVGVSANGVDVYFATTEALVTGDENGAALRFYDARTNGGFPVAAAVAPCAAADECHGAGSSVLPAPRVSSSAGLGATGNTSLNRCVQMARRARAHTRRVKALRRKVKRAAAGSNRRLKRRVPRLRVATRRSVRRARRSRSRAKRCRVLAQRRARINRRAGG